MPSFSDTSLAKLNTCHPDIVRVCTAIIADVDCSIIEGHRSIERQRELFRAGMSKLNPDDETMLSKCKHLPSPSHAVDVAPYPIDWDNRLRFTLFAGYLIGRAFTMGVRLRWGGDWNGNFDPTDQSFHDLPHFELREP